MNETAVEGKVAQLVNERELVINRGQQDGVVRGMKFAVLAATPTEVIDPDSKQVLGVIDREKVRVEARTVADKFAICATYQRKVVGGGMLSASAEFTTLTQPRREVFTTLKASKESYPEPLSETESYVKIGDRVRQIVD